MRRLLLAVIGAVVAATVIGGPVSAHEEHSLGGGAWLSEVTSVSALNLYAVIGGDSVVNITVEPGVAAEVPGYDNEPYLRISADGAWEANVTSPTWWVNQDPDTLAELGEGIDAEAPPQWEPAATGRLIAFHDHRIHWMGAELPERDLTVPFKLNDWSIPVIVDGVPATIDGALWFDVDLIGGAAVRYANTPETPTGGAAAVTPNENSDKSNLALTAGALLLIAAVAGGGVMLIRNARRPGS